ncbi:MAG: redoxin domain-containing protein [Sphingobacteriales bacterium]|nr:redoxin domain-containing protein [Sphingobacteriales bacterium]
MDIRVRTWLFISQRRKYLAMKHRHLSYCFIGAIILLMAFPFSSKAQVAIGEMCPNVKIKGIENYPGKEANMADLKGKAVILIFWSTRCSESYSSFKKFDSIQAKFKHSLQIILVSRESKQRIDKVLGEQLLQGVSIPYVTEDTVFNHLFPNFLVPHQIWMDSNGIVRAITGGGHLTTQNINLLINGNALENIPVKRDNLEYRNSGFDTPLAGIEFKENKKNLLFYSYFSQYRPEIGGGYRMPFPDSASGVIQVRVTNSSVKTLYEVAYSGDFKNGDPIVMSFFKDSTKLLPDFVEMKNIFCYELFASDTSYSGFLYKMRNDLDMHLDIESRLISFPMDCYVVKRIPQNPIQRTERLSKPEVVFEKNRIKMKNVSFHYVVLKQLEDLLKKTIVDESGYNGKLDFEIPVQYGNLGELNKFIRAFGFEVHPEKRLMQVVGLFDRP